MPNNKKRQPPPKERPTSVVGIGASAGGLEAFEQLLSAMRTDTGMAFVLVQHLAPKHESILSELLGRKTTMPVVEVKDGMTLMPNHVYVIPPNADLSIGGGELHLSEPSNTRAHRMPIDFFLRSLAEDQRGRAIGVILSGTASDGTLGLRSIKALGGITFAQDDKSAKYGAMPRNAAAAGVVDFVLPPSQIAAEITRIGKHIHLLTADDAFIKPTLATRDEALDSIFHTLQKASRIDFSHYKQGTINRRVSRRMFLHKMETVKQYAQFLQKDPDEVEALFNDLLINVTGFFRDPEAFEVLRKHAFPSIVENAANSQIRMWVPGCSTGEEAYSLAIALVEYLADAGSNLQVQIFATDVSDAIVQKARLAMYPESIALDVKPDYLRRFFQRADHAYQVSRRIRDMCVFAKQDLTKDPPFSKLDMISCRNVMIYLDQVLQKRILPLFHYALNPGGILFLGTSETVGNHGDLFVQVEKKQKIYSKKSVSNPVRFDLIPAFKADGDGFAATQQPHDSPDMQKLVHQVLLSRYAPASVLVNEKLDILHFVGQTGAYLEPASGEASLNLLKMVKPGLHKELRTAFQKVRRSGPIRKEGVLVEQGSTLKAVDFEIVPIWSAGKTEIFYLIILEESTPAERAAAKTDGAGRRQKDVKKSTKSKDRDQPADYGHLKDELDATHEYLQSIIEEQRTTNEELRSANEEIQSSNEEFQSINEELETAKEELQSTNEELTTVNEELQNRNDELMQLNSDLNNLLSSVHIPIVMLSSDMRLRRFTPTAEKLMNLIPADVGRPFNDIKSNLKIGDLRDMIARVSNTLETQEVRVEDTAGRWYSLRIRPYRTLDNKIDGVVIVLLEAEERALLGKPS
jgi:two-component system CheB/CheR fusion protein